jgi:mRNA interferase HigB
MWQYQHLTTFLLTTPQEYILCETFDDFAQLDNLVPQELTPPMNVISYRKIREFILNHADSDAGLNAWYATAKRAKWQNLAEVQQRYLHADLVGRYTVFNISNNKYRLITRIVYRSQTIFIIDIFTHQEYDDWKT